MRRLGRKVLAFSLCVFILMSSLLTLTVANAAGTDGILGTDGSPRHALGDVVGITLKDADLNTDPGQAESVDVSVTSSGDSTPINVTLFEQGNNSDIFTGKFKLVAGDSSEAPVPKELGAAVGDTVTVAYNDDVNPANDTTSFEVVADKAAMPSANPDHGIVGDGTKISLSSNDGADIYYTIDGSGNPPAQYSDPDSMPAISGHTIIRAVAKKDGVADSDTAIFEYNIPGFCVKVTDPSCSSVIQGANVEVRSSDNTQFICNGQTGPDGTIFLNPQSPMADGTYKIRAYPPNNSAYAVSDQITATLSGGGLSDNIQAIALNNPAITGTVQKPDHSAASNGGIDVELKTGDNQGQWLFGMPINSNDGTFNLPPLAPGDYRIRANPPDDPANSSFSPSDGFIYHVDAIPANSTSSVNLVYKSTQIRGTVTDPDGQAVGGDKFDYRVRSTDPGVDFNNIQYDIRNFDNTYKVSGLPQGDYAIKAVPRANQPFADSFEQTFSIDGSGNVTESQGTASDGIIDLQLTNPQLTGIVKNPVSVDENPVNGGNVDIFISNDIFLGSVPVNSDGTFKIGGLKNDSYKIKANPPQGSPYISSDMIPISVANGVCDPATAELRLNEKILKLNWVDNAYKGDSDISMRLDNISLLGNPPSLSTLSATVSHNGQVQNIVLTNPRLGQCWGEEGTLIFSVNGGVQLPFGKYTIDVKNNNASINFNDNTFNIIQRLVVNPGVVTPSSYKTNGMTVSLDVEDRNGNKDYPWSPTDSLTVKITADGNPRVDEYLNLNASANQNDNVRTLVIPAKANAIAGRRDIEVYNGTQLLATGGFDVGDPQITEVFSTENSNEVVVFGTCLGNYQSNNTYAEVWLNGGGKIATSTSYDLWNEIHFRFNTSFDPSKDYKLKIFAGGQEKTPNGGIAFKAIPQLECDNPVIVFNQEHPITIPASTIQGFGWSAADNLTVKVYGPGCGLSAVNGQGITVSDNSLSLTMSQAQGYNSPLQNGDYKVEVFNGASRVGFAEFMVVAGSNDVLQGTVRNSSNTGVSGGGTLRIEKENEGWNETIPVQKNGKFYYMKDRFPNGNRDGNYILTANPSKDSTDSAGKYVLNITGGNLANNNIVINLQAAQVEGTVKIGGSNAAGGNVDVFDNSANKWERILSVEVAADGSYKIGGLNPGTYYISANPPGDLKYLSSDAAEIVIDGNTVLPVTQDLTLVEPQITGTARNFDGSDLSNYDVTVRNVYFGECSYGLCATDGAFIIGKMKPGTYAISIIPRGDSPYTQSFETQITIAQNGTATPGSINLQLTQPKLTGIVKDKDGNPLNNMNAYVSIYKGSWTDLQQISYAPVSPNGSFKIGGLADGDYYLQAGVKDDSPLYNANSMSVLTKVTIGTTLTQNLTLTDRSKPRIRWINDCFVGDNKINVRLFNFKNMDMSKLKAEILTEGGSSLSPQIKNTYLKIAWNDSWTDEADLEINMDSNINVTPGKYTLKLTYNNVDVLSDSPSGNKFSIYHNLSVMPKGAKPAQTQGMSVKLFVDNGNGGTVPGIWNTNDTLDIKLIATDGQVYDNLSKTINQDNTITATLPGVLNGGALPDGNNTIQILRGGVLLASGMIIVGNPVFTGVDAVNEGDDHISVEGQYIALYDDPSTFAEVLDPNNNNSVIETSTNINFMWGSLVFNFNGSKLAAGKYKLRITYKNSQLPLLDFNVVPQLVCDPHAVDGTSAANVTLKNSSSADFKWGNDASISDFSVIVKGPDFGYDLDSSNGLAFDGNKNLVVNIKAPQGMGYPLQTGYGYIEVFKNGNKIGFSNFTIGHDVITGTVFNPDGTTPVPYAKVRITNLTENDNSNYMVTADSEGKFYITDPKELPRNDESHLNGQYSFLAMPPQDSQYASAVKIANINPAAVNTVSVVLNESQVAGTVKEGLTNAKGGSIEVQQAAGDHWNYLYDIDVNSDGTFKLGGLQKGTYYLKAHPTGGSEYVSSDFKEIVVGDNPVNAQIDLNPVQLGGAVTDALGNPLKGFDYDIYIRQLNPAKGDKFGYEPVTQDGKYMVGNLEPGSYAISIRPRDNNSVYTQSYETTFTIENDKTASDDDIPLQLTQPKLTGTVVYGTSPAKAFTEGNVDVSKGTWQNMEYVTNVGIDKDGKFRVGGLPNGKYFIRATLWDKSSLRGTYSQSITTEINLVDNTPTVQLALRDKAPRIKWIENALIGNDIIRVHMLNVEALDFSKMTAQVLTESGQPLSTPINISGAGNFTVEGESWDHYNDEVNVAIRINGGINLPAGKYTLKLVYNNNNVASDSPDGYLFNICYQLNVDPYGVTPEDTLGKVLKLNAVGKDVFSNPWTLSDTLVVRLNANDGTQYTLNNSIAGDNTLTATLPQLSEGNYKIEVYKGTQLLGSGDLDVGTPKVDKIDDPNDLDNWLTIEGYNLIVYMDPTTEGKIYDKNNNLLITTKKLNFMWGSLQFDMSGMTLPYGEYKLVMSYKNQPVALPNDGKFNVGALVMRTPAYLQTGYAADTTITLDMPAGKIAPWTNGDTLAIKLFNEWDKQNEYDITPSNVTATSITFTMPNGIGEGSCSIFVYEATAPDASTYIAYSKLDIVSQVQLKGIVKDSNNNPAPYAYVEAVRQGDNNSFGFTADKNGKYSVHFLDPGNYTVTAYPPKDATLLSSEGFDITINPDRSSSASNHDFVLLPGKKISGTVSLPNGEAAPEGGMDMWLGAFNDNGTPDNKDDDTWKGAEVKMPGGASSAGYSVVVPADNKDYVVQLWGGQQGGYIDSVYYSAGGSVFDAASATKLNSGTGDKAGIDIELVHGNEITGTVGLPSGTAPSGGISVNINAVKDNNNNDPYDDMIQGTQVVIPQGQSSVAYKIYVPAASGYKVTYNIDNKFNYIGQGYYKTQTETTYDQSLAGTVDTSTSNQANINLKLLPAKFITGTVRLPNNGLAPTGGLDLWIGACNDKGTPNDGSDDYWAGTGAHIAANTNSVDYKIMVPDMNNDFVVQLWCQGPGLVDGPTYYSSTGSVFRLSAAARLNVSTGDKAGINITLVKGITISGTITLPEAAPSGGRAMGIRAVNDNNNQDSTDDIVPETKVIVPEGQTSVNYSINVPAMSGYRVQYVADPAYLYEADGFYSTTGTVFDYSKASFVDASTANVSGINLNVSPALNPVCVKAAATEDGTAVQLIFSKPLNQAVTKAGFKLTVDGTQYSISSVTLDQKGMMLSINLDPSNKLYKDYKSIKLDYTKAGGVIKSYDNKDLLDIAGMDVVNKSLKALIIQGVFNGDLINHDVLISVISAGETISVTENGGSNLLSNGIANISGEGPHTVVISSTGRKANTTYTFTIDKTAPDITITNCSSVKNNANGVTPGINFANDCVATTKVVTLNGRPYDGSAIKAAGHYILTATAKDAAGNVKAVKQEFDIVWDTSMPVITFDNITNGGIYESVTIGISLACDANTLQANSNAANYKYTAKLTKPDGTILAFDKTSIPDVTAEGKYRLEVLAVNPGYTEITSSKVVEFTVDKTAPTASIGNVTDSHLYNTAVTPVISFGDTVSSQQLLLKNATLALTKDNASISYNMGDTISSDGTYTLTAKTKDAMNHESPVATVTFTIDRTKPVITLSGALNGYTYKDQNVIITAKANEGTLTATCNGQDIVLDGDGKYTFSGEAGKTVDYKLYFKALDNAGNVTEQQLAFTIDRLAVNIIVNGISDGMVINYSPEISFTTFEGTTEKQGTTATIDGTAFAGGKYTTAGAHVLSVKYISGGNTYTKTINFIIDKTAPSVSVSSVTKNDAAINANAYVKAGDTIKVRANVSDANGINNVSFSVGNAAIKVPMAFAEGSGYYEGQFTVEGGNFADLSVAVAAKDKAGNAASQTFTYTVTIDNTKPSVSMVTNPLVADGNNGLFKASNMNITLAAGSADTICYTLNGTPGTATATKVLAPAQGTNILDYYAQDLAGNKSDEKIYVFGYDSVKPANVGLTSPATGTVNFETVQINGTVPGEGANTGTKVLLKKSGEIIAKATVKSDNTFAMDGIKLIEGLNTFTLTAIDLAGNESVTPTAVSRTLDSTAPVVKVEKIDDNNYKVTLNETISGNLMAKFNGVVVDPNDITSTDALTFNVAVPGQIAGTNILNVTAVDSATNTGTGSFTSTYIPPSTAQNDVPLNDNASMDIPNNAFDSQIQMMVKTVDLNQSIDYKLLGAPISFEFRKDDNSKVEPSNPLLVKNYIGVGLTGVVLMHVMDDGTVDTHINAIPTTSAELNTNTMGTFEQGFAYYLSDTGYIVFKTKTFSGFGSALDNTPPAISITSTDFNISAADLDSGNVHLAGTLTDTDNTSHISEVTVDGNPVAIAGAKGMAFDVTFALTDGTHEVVVKAVDAAGNSSTATKTYNVDITNPTLTANASAATTNRDTVDISVETSENAEVFVNGASKGYVNGSSIIPFALTNGADNTINVSATDAFGNTSAVTTLNVTRDSNPPEITITGVSDGDVYGAAVTINVSVTDHEGHLQLPYTVTLDGDVTNVNQATHQIICNTEGQHTLVVVASDSFGNTSTSTIIFTIDTSVPVITISGADQNGLYNTDKTLSINADNTDTLTVTKSVDGQPAQNVTVAGTTASLILGTSGEQHSYRITATARKTVSGQIRNATSHIDLTVDEKAPSVTLNTAAQTEEASMDITGTVDEAADIYLNGSKVITGSPAGAFSISGQNLAMGDNVFNVKAVDGAGNESPIVTITVKRVAPQPPEDVVPGGKTTSTPGVSNTQTVTPEPDLEVVINGDLQTVVDTENGIATTQVDSAVLNAKIDELIKSAGNNSQAEKTVTIELPKLAVSTQEVVLDSSTISTIANRDVNISIKTENSVLAIPAELLKEFAGQSVKVEVKSIEGSAKDDLISSLPESSRKNISLAGPVVEFTIKTVKDKQEQTVSKFNEKIKVQLEVPAEELSKVDTNKLGIYYLDETRKEWVYAGGKFDKATGKIEADVSHFTKFTVIEFNKTFNDIPANFWGKQYIEILVARHVVTGMDENSFAPSGKVTRAQFATFIAKALNLPLEGYTGKFTDVSSNDWFAQYVEAVAKAGIVSGTGDGKFSPDAEITREQMAVMIMNAYKYVTGRDASSIAKGAKVKFDDMNKASNWAQDAIKAAYSLKLISGMSETQFAPKDSSQRAQGAAIIVKLLEAINAI